MNQLIPIWLYRWHVRQCPNHCGGNVATCPVAQQQQREAV